MIAAAGDGGRRARRRPHRAVQSGGRRGAAAAHRSALHRSPPARHVSRAQPRHRRRLRPDDSRPRRRAVARAVRGRVDRSGRRAGADRPRRHRQRAAAVRERLHRQPDRQPHQPRPGAEDPLLPAGGVRVDRLRRAEGRGAGGWSSGDRPDAVDRRRRGRRRRTRSRSSASWPTSSTPSRRAAPPRVTGEHGPPRARAGAADCR